MNNILKKLKKWNNPFKMDHSNHGELNITEGLPLPIRNVEYREVLRVFRTLEKLPVSGSFSVKSELGYVVRKLTNNHFPHYKVTIRNFGSDHRVYRIA